MYVDMSGISVNHELGFIPHSPPTTITSFITSHHFLSVISFGALSIQVNEIMRDKNGHHHHHFL